MTVKTKELSLCTVSRGSNITLKLKNFIVFTIHKIVKIVQIPINSLVALL